MLDGGPLDASPHMTAGQAALPRDFGPFELLEEVARGGMGIVYRARQMQINRTVAVKVLAAGRFASPDFVKRFRTEAEAVASLDHPNIVPVYEVGECEGQPFFSMKFVEGGSLARRISGLKSPIASREAAELLATLARAVHYAHQRGILHRDIKPGNVLLDAQGEPHLTDFGLARLVEQNSTLTHTVAMLGTPSYMSPEQARGEAKQLTTAVDVYGLGAIFYELLTGQPPFAGGTTMETVRQVLDKDPRRPSTLQPGMDRDLETICLKCLEKDPSRRYGSAEALAADLERWLGHEPILARPASALESVAKWIRRHRAGFVAMVTITLLLVTGVAVTTWQAVRATKAEALATQHLGESQRNERRAGQARREADALAEQRRHDLVRMHVAAGNELVGEGDAFTGLLQFVAALRLEKGDPVREDVHRRRLAGVLRTAPRLLQLWTRLSQVTSARWHPDGTRFICGDPQGLRVYDVNTGESLIVPIKTTPPVVVAWFTPDGRYVATADAAGKVRHWDPLSGQPAGPLLPTLVTSVAGRTYRDALDYSPDGRLLAAIMEDGVQFLAVPSGEPAGPLLKTTGRVAQVRFSPDGRTASICGRDPSLQIVEVPSGRLVWSPSQLSQPVRFSAFSPDGQTLVSAAGTDSYSFDIWNLASGERRIETLGNQLHPYDLQFSPNGRWIASITASDARLLDGRTGRQVGERMKHDSHVTQFEFSSDATQFATASFDRTVRIWDPATGRSRGPALQHTAILFEARFSPDGERLLTSCIDGTARLWNLPNNAGARLTLIQRLRGASWIRVSPDSHHVLEFNQAGSVRIWDTRSGQVSAEWDESEPGTAAAYSPDGSRVALAVGQGKVQCRDGATGTKLFSVSHPGKVISLGFSPDGQQLLTAGNDATARLWLTDSGTPAAPALIHDGAVRHAAFSRDGRYVVTGSEDRKTRMWDARSGAPVGVPLETHSPPVVAAINAGGTRILTIRDFITREKDGTVANGATQLWDAITRTPIGPEQSLLSAARYPAAFSPDGRRFLMLQDTENVAICDAGTGRRAAPLLKHKDLPTGFDFSPDGRLLFTHTGQVVRVWDATTGEPVSPPLHHDGRIISAEWTADGRELVTNASDGKIRVWDVSPENSSVTELEQLAELLAAHRLDSQLGAVPLTPSEMGARWEAMNGRPSGH